MRLTTKGRFAVTAMIDLALRQNSGPVTLAAISQRQQISLSYLEQLFGKLRRHDLVESTRGPGGGYQLQRAVSTLSVWDVVSCFRSEDADAKPKENSSEFSAALDLNQQLESIKSQFLQAYPLVEVLKHMPSATFESDDLQTSSMNFHFKPIQKPVLPTAPNSVFDLSNYLQLRAA